MDEIVSSNDMSSCHDDTPRGEVWASRAMNAEDYQIPLAHLTVQAPGTCGRQLSGSVVS